MTTSARRVYVSAHAAACNVFFNVLRLSRRMNHRPILGGCCDGLARMSMSSDPLPRVPASSRLEKVGSRLIVCAPQVHCTSVPHITPACYAALTSFHVPRQHSGLAFTSLASFQRLSEAWPSRLSKQYMKTSPIWNVTESAGYRFITTSVLITPMRESKQRVGQGNGVHLLTRGFGALMPDPPAVETRLGVKTSIVRKHHYHRLSELFPLLPHFSCLAAHHVLQNPTTPTGLHDSDLCQPR